MSAGGADPARERNGLATRAPDAGSPESASQRCRNCGALAAGAYCPACGQETRARLPTLREFTREAAGRYVAVDGTLWRTLGALLLRPGFLTREYLAGRRRRYVRPLRLYLAASLLCFVVAGFAFDDGVLQFGGDAPEEPAAASRSTGPAGPGAAAGKSRRAVGTLAIDPIGAPATFVLPDVLRPAELAVRSRIERFDALPAQQRTERLASGMRRLAPYAMFALVPAFALLLKLVYPRRRRLPSRPSLYGEHLVFAVHAHAFFFLTVAATAVLPAWPAAAAWTWAALYPVLALRRVYGGGWIGAVARAGALFTLYLPMIVAMVGVLAVAAIVIG